MPKNNTKQSASMQQNPLVLLAMGLVLLAITYGAGSWAVDSGRWSLYAATFVSLYFGVRYLTLAAKKLFNRK